MLIILWWFISFPVVDLIHLWVILIWLTARDQCEPPPCLHAGNCTNQVGGFQCSCPAPYSGTNCGQRDGEPPSASQVNAPGQTTPTVQLTPPPLSHEGTFHLSYPWQHSTPPSSRPEQKSLSSVRLAVRQRVTRCARCPTAPSPAPAPRDSNYRPTNAAVCLKVPPPHTHTLTCPGQTGDITTSLFPQGSFPADDFLTTRPRQRVAMETVPGR